jgi:hypothetical protein
LWEYSCVLFSGRERKRERERDKVKIDLRYPHSLLSTLHSLYPTYYLPTTCYLPTYLSITHTHTLSLPPSLPDSLTASPQQPTHIRFTRQTKPSLALVQAIAKEKPGERLEIKVRVDT